MSCKRSDEFIGTHDVGVKETIDAKKTRFAAADLDEVLGTATKLFAARGKKVVEFALKDADREALEKIVIGPSGNLRAPTARGTPGGRSPAPPRENPCRL